MLFLSLTLWRKDRTKSERQIFFSVPHIWYVACLANIWARDWWVCSVQCAVCAITGDPRGYALRGRSHQDSTMHGRMNYKETEPYMSGFLKIDLLSDYVALCLTDFTDFIDWRYIHSWLVFSTHLVNCCPHGWRNYTCVLLPLYPFSLTYPPPPS